MYNHAAETKEKLKGPAKTVRPGGASQKNGRERKKQGPLPFRRKEETKETEKREKENEKAAADLS